MCVRGSSRGVYVCVQEGRRGVYMFVYNRVVAGCIYVCVR